MKARTIPLSKFERWLLAEQRAGLVNFKLSINHRKGATLDKVRAEILHLDALAATGQSADLPTATVFLPPQILALINSAQLTER